MKEEKNVISREELQEILANVEEAQVRSGEYHSHHHHSSHHHSHSGSGDGKSGKDQIDAGSRRGTKKKKNDSSSQASHKNRKTGKRPSGRSFSEKKRRRKRKVLRGVLIFFAVLFLIIGGGAGTLYFMIIRGEKLLRQETVGMTPELVTISTEEGDLEVTNVEDNSLIYKGVKYRYNEDILNFLIVGVDTNGEIEDTYGSHGNGIGQADTLILGVMDNEKQSFTLIPINRDTITAIDIYDVNGEFYQSAQEQIALSFAYGDGRHKSAQLTEKAVSNLFYGLPIHGYIVVNIEAIALVNDMMGGVEITLEDDYTEVFGSAYQKGATVTLQGKDAEKFIRTRYGIGAGNNEARMNQQKQYLGSMIQKALKLTREDLKFPVSVYNVLTKYMITDITSSKVAYLASRSLNFKIADDFYRKIPGESVTSEVYEEFYVDEAAFYELMLDVFYNKVL